MSALDNLQEARRALLAKRIQQARERKTTVQQIGRRPAGEPIPLSFAQQRLWFLYQWEPDSPTYNVPWALFLTGTLDVSALQRALDEVVRRHEVLRTCYQSIKGEPHLVLLPEPHQLLQIVDMEALPPQDRLAEAQRQAVIDAAQPFDLARDLPIRATLLTLSPTEHALLLTMHHIATDGWSGNVLLNELAALYRSFTGQPTALPELAIQYADFAYWQRQWLQGEVLEQQLAYWKEQLGGALPVLELPADRPRPTAKSYRGRLVQFSLPLLLSERLRALGRQEGASLFMTMLAAFNVLLSRYSGQEDLVVGTPIANRNRSELENLIGFFINTLALRTRLAGNPSFRELLAQVREVALGAYAHQDLPFEKLVEELQPERDMRRTPFFQVMLMLQNMPGPPVDLAGLNATLLDYGHRTAKFDLTLAVQDNTGRLEGVIEYDTDLFDRERIERMGEHLQVLLEGIVANPNRRIAELPLLTPDELQKRQAWNATRADYPQDRCLPQLLEAQAERTPQATAVITDEGMWSYGELNVHANRIAHRLHRLGVGPEVRVGLCLDRSETMLAALWAIGKAGGAYLPLDPSYPRERLAFMLENSGTSLLLTQRKWLDRLPLSRVQTLCLDEEEESLRRECPENLPPLAHPDNLAYLLYTSGSTGVPKGVLVTQRALVNFLSHVRRLPGLDPSDTLLAVTTLSFDIAGLELWLPLLVGARLVLARRDETSSGSDLAGLLARHQVSALQATPATWQLLSEAGWQGRPGFKVLCGGEALPPGLADRLLSGGAELWNLYGPTETTVWSAVRRVELVDGPVPLGGPIANTQLHILDRHLNPVPLGVPGELYIGGTGLARGYHRRPGLTAERFVPNPFSPEPGARLYRTGDLARRRPDGTIDFLGRTDHQVKLRGYRIELGEIEAVLAAHPAVREAVVLAREDRPGDVRLVAYLVAQEGLVETELRTYLQARLPAYMLPTAWVMLEQLPLTPSGKVDRRALPAPDSVGRAEEAEFIAPRTDMEELIAEVWGEVLRRERVGIHDNFFELGGHSLLATQVVSRIRDQLEVDLPVRSLFEAPTLVELAGRVEQALTDKILALDERTMERLLADG